MVAGLGGGHIAAVWERVHCLAGFHCHSNRFARMKRCTTSDLGKYSAGTASFSRNSDLGVYLIHCNGMVAMSSAYVSRAVCLSICSSICLTRHLPIRSLGEGFNWRGCQRCQCWGGSRLESSHSSTRGHSFEDKEKGDASDANAGGGSKLEGMPMLGRGRMAARGGMRGGGLILIVGRMSEGGQNGGCNNFFRPPSYNYGT